MNLRSLLALLGMLLLTAFAGAEPRPAQEGKILKEVWEAAFLDGNQNGHTHSVFREVVMGERTQILALTEMELNLVRFNQSLQIQFGMSDVETPEGKVLGFVVQQTLAKDQVLTRKGKIEGKQLTITVEMPGRQPTEVKMPWNDKSLGLYAQEQLLKNRKLEPNTEFDFVKFEPTLDTWLTIHVRLKDLEEVSLLKGEKKRLLRVETHMDKLMGVQLPPEIAWVDAQGEILKRQAQLPGLGTLITYRSTKEQALARGGKAPVDIGIAQLVRVNRVISRPNDTSEVVYKIRIRDEKEPLTLLAQDLRQKARNLKGEEFELVVKSQAAPSLEPRQPPPVPPAEYLRSNSYLPCDDARVKALAQRAVGTERDPWEKAQRIESWVRNNVTHKNFTEAFATADKVARSLEGDCSEHAVLAAAMCRAVGVPARTVIGLVHYPPEQAMGYHMWIEVWINGQWIALDPTLGQGRVGATHLKISDQHWNDTQAFLPFLPLTRVLGKLQIEIVSVRYE